MPSSLISVQIFGRRSTSFEATSDTCSGYFSDPEDLPGLAHFCEHMLFLGTEPFPEENSCLALHVLSEHPGNDESKRGEIMQFQLQRESLDILEGHDIHAGLHSPCFVKPPRVVSLESSAQGFDTYLTSNSGFSNAFTEAEASGMDPSDCYRPTGKAV